MTDSAPAPTAAGSARTSEPWANWIAWELLPGQTRDALTPLFRYLAAVRAVVDHPALTTERKEAALADLAAPFTDAGRNAEAPAGPWAETATALAAVLAARDIDSRAPGQILQAAGQDLRKTRYRDWSALLTWCRFAAAPAGVVVFRLAGGTSAADGAAERLSIALQLVEIVRRAPSHHAWLGRVYLPERWFAEARCDMDDLAFTEISEPLAHVIGRMLDQAEALIAEAETMPARLPGFRLRRALHAAILELRGEIVQLRRQTAWSRPHARPARLPLLARATWRALRRR